MIEPMPTRPDPRNQDGPQRSELLERAAHDLKNPLAVVRSALEWLAVELEGREDALDAIRDATTAGARLVAIVDDLDALARLDRDSAIASESTDVTAMIGQVTSVAATRLSERGLSIVSSAPPSARIDGDADLLVRSLHALIDACARGAPLGTCIEMQVRLGDLVEIEIGQRGTSPSAPETTAIDELASGGLGVYVALQVANAHRGSLVVLPTETMPRALIRLPRSPR
jgi:signal transduction histidine kinase